MTTPLPTRNSPTIAPPRRNDPIDLARPRKSLDSDRSFRSELAKRRNESSGPVTETKRAARAGQSSPSSRSNESDEPTIGANGQHSESVTEAPARDQGAPDANHDADSSQPESPVTPVDAIENAGDQTESEAQGTPVVAQVLPVPIVALESVVRAETQSTQFSSSHAQQPTVDANLNQPNTVQPQVQEEPVDPVRPAVRSDNAQFRPETERTSIEQPVRSTRLAIGNVEDGAPVTPSTPNKGPAKTLHSHAQPSSGPASEINISNSRIANDQSQFEQAGDQSARDRNAAATRPTRVEPLTVETQTDRSFTPALARAAQVEVAVQLENLTTQSLDSATPTVTTSTVSNALQAATAGARAESIETLLAPPQKPGEESLFSRQVVRGLTAMVNQRGGMMTMGLQPPELGHLRIQMSIVQGTVNAQFTATSEHALSMLESGLPTLRAALQQQGLTVDRISVHLAAPESANTTRFEAADQQQQDARNEHDSSYGESRGRQQYHDQSRARSNSTIDDFRMQFDSWNDHPESSAAAT